MAALREVASRCFASGGASWKRRQCGSGGSGSRRAAVLAMAALREVAIAVLAEWRASWKRGGVEAAQI